MTTSDLTDVQRAHVAAFNKRTGAGAVNLKYYEKKKFGPWNPYWRVYDLVVNRFSHPAQRLLSFGCGNGRDAIIYAHVGYNVYGFDIAPNAIQIADEMAAESGYQQRTHFSVQAAEDLDYPDAYFDLVVGTNVLHHVDRDRAVPQIARVLKPGGMAIFKEPLSTPVRDKIRRLVIPNWLIPEGAKNIFQDYRYDLVPGEKNLDRDDFRVVEDHFGNLVVERWRVLALLNIILPWRVLLERCDWVLLQSLPFLRRFGDQAVLIFCKK